MDSYDSSSRDLFMILGLLMGRLGMKEVEFSWQEVLWGMSGTEVVVQWNGDGDVRIDLVPIGNLGIKGAGAVCPWPVQRHAGPREIRRQDGLPVC